MNARDGHQHGRKDSGGAERGQESKRQENAASELAETAAAANTTPGRNPSPS
jgi:hypothetical protein